MENVKIKVHLAEVHSLQLQRASWKKNKKWHKIFLEPVFVYLLFRFVFICFFFKDYSFLV